MYVLMKKFNKEFNGNGDILLEYSYENRKGSMALRFDASRISSWKFFLDKVFNDAEEVSLFGDGSLEVADFLSSHDDELGIEVCGSYVEPEEPKFMVRRAVTVTVETGRGVLFDHNFMVYGTEENLDKLRAEHIFHSEDPVQDVYVITIPSGVDVFCVETYKDDNQDYAIVIEYENGKEYRKVPYDFKLHEDDEELFNTFENNTKDLYATDIYGLVRDEETSDDFEDSEEVREWTSSHLYEVSRDFHFSRYEDAFIQGYDKDSDLALQMFWSDVISNGLGIKFLENHDDVIKFIKVLYHNYNSSMEDLCDMVGDCLTSDEKFDLRTYEYDLFDADEYRDREVEMAKYYQKPISISKVVDRKFNVIKNLVKNLYIEARSHMIEEYTDDWNAIFYKTQKMMKKHNIIWTQEDGVPNWIELNSYNH